MLAKFFSRTAKPVAPVACAPHGRRIYAIGDIHGRLDLLNGLLEQIFRNSTALGGPPAELIFLGDLIDRGPDSAGVIERLMSVKAERPETRFLLGNHEEVFLKVLGGDRKALRLFHRIGGAETVQSYGISPEVYAAADFDELAAMLEAAVPESHRVFLAGFEDLIAEGDYVFVHAGIRPGVPLENQNASDLRWIRDEFVSPATGQQCGIPGKVVVHGHTITEGVVEKPHRIGLDTGAYRSGILTAMGFENDQRWILQEERVRECDMVG
ncbi:metallophosphoesterase family protein [Novosphingobium sp. BL-8A]|uniref:metallophosphoesterase family protein n=1 Tax=Novosphingobium sp. BL-8A TaxID=3127639 RepID=UPI003756A2BD